MKHTMQKKGHKIIQYTLLFIIGIALIVSFLLDVSQINVSSKVGI